MRYLFLLLVAAGLNFSLPSLADTVSPENEALTENSEWQNQWNRWVCWARPFRGFQRYRGESYFFRAGSGEGQEAKRFASLMAERNCEYYTRNRCISREQNCSVQRFQ